MKLLQEFEAEQLGWLRLQARYSALSLDRLFHISSFLQIYDETLKYNYLLGEIYCQIISMDLVKMFPNWLLPSSGGFLPWLLLGVESPRLLFSP